MAITKLAGPVGHHDSDDDDYEFVHHPEPQQAPEIVAPQPVPVPVNQSTISSVSTAAVDIEAWTVAALESLRIANNARGTGNPLVIPLDGTSHGEPAAAAGPTDPALKLRNVVFDDGDDTYAANVAPPRRPPSRRDSMKRREALMKGKEGSRQRRRWENGNYSSLFVIRRVLLGLKSSSHSSQSMSHALGTS